MRLAEPARRLEAFLGFLAVLVDILNDKLADDDEWYGEEHAGRAEQLTAEHDAEDDGHGMQVERLADERRIDDVVVELRQDQVEAGRLDGNPGIDRRRQQDTEGRSDCWAEHRNEFADARHHGEDRRIRQVARSVINQDNRGRDGADDELAADVDAQRGQDAVEECEHAAVIAPCEQARAVRLDVVAVLQQVERHEEDDDHVDEFIEDRQQDGQRGL